MKLPPLAAVAARVRQLIQKLYTMSQDLRMVLQCTEADCKELNYNSKKSKLIKQRLELKKFCKHCKRMTLHKETK